MKKVKENFRIYSSSLIIATVLVFSISACEYEVVEPDQSITSQSDYQDFPDLTQNNVDDSKGTDGTREIIK